jgi:pullulanase
MDRPAQLISYTLNNNANGDRWKIIVVLFNAGSKQEKVKL